MIQQEKKIIQSQHKRKKEENVTDLKLAVDTHSQPILTTHCALSSVTVVSAWPVSDIWMDEHGRVLSGRSTPLSRANCSRQIGRKRVRETMTKASLRMG